MLWFTYLPYLTKWRASVGEAGIGSLYCMFTKINTESEEVLRQRLYIVAVTLLQEVFSTLAKSIPTSTSIWCCPDIHFLFPFGAVWIQGIGWKWGSEKCLFSFPLFIQTPEKENGKSSFPSHFSLLHNVFLTSRVLQLILWSCKSHL